MSNQLRNLQDHVRAMEERKKNDDMVLQNEYRKTQDRESVLLAELAASKSTASSLENENSQLRNNVNVLETSVKGVDEVNKKYEEVRKSEVALRNVVNELKGSVGKLEDEVQAKSGRIQELERECQGLKEIQEDQDNKARKVNGEVADEVSICIARYFIEPSSTAISKIC